MHQAVFTGEDIHKGAKVHQAYHFTFVDCSGFHVGGNLFDPTLRLFRRRQIRRRDLDGPIILDIDGRSGGFRNCANGHPAFTDDITNLVGRNR